MEFGVYRLGCKVAGEGFRVYNFMIWWGVLRVIRVKGMMVFRNIEVTCLWSFKVRDFLHVRSDFFLVFIGFPGLEMSEFRGF